MHDLRDLFAVASDLSVRYTANPTGQWPRPLLIVVLGLFSHGMPHL
jgi:hypothetical protein